MIHSTTDLYLHVVHVSDCGGLDTQFVVSVKFIGTFLSVFKNTFCMTLKDWGQSSLKFFRS